MKNDANEADSNEAKANEVVEAEGQASTPPKPGPEVRVPVQEKPSPPVKKRPSFMRRAARWLLGLLLVFGLGAVAAMMLFYLPLRESTSQREADLETANQEIAGLESRVEGLLALEEKNQELQAQLDQAILHVAILRSRTDITSAQLALANNDPAKARVALSKTSQTLQNMAKLLETDQQKVVTGLQDRLKLALSEIGGNNYAAQSDLDVLATGLLELENAYFAGP